MNFKRKKKKRTEHLIFIYVVFSIEKKINMKATKNVITWCAFDSGESDRALKYYNLCAFSLSFCHLFRTRVLSDVVQSLLFSFCLQFFLYLGVICQLMLHFFVLNVTLLNNLNYDFHLSNSGVLIMGL